jgi:hypothetical protein
MSAITNNILSLVNEKTIIMYGWTASQLAAPVKEDNYGMDFPRGVTQYFKEAAGYRMGGFAGHDKFFHLINMIKLDLPDFEFVSRGYINNGAMRVLKACCDHNDLGIAGAASTGKTYPVGAYIIQDWKSAPDRTLSFVCTTSLAASEDRIWGAIVKMFQSSVHKIGVYIPHKYVISYNKLSDSAADRDYNAAIKALAIEQGREGKKAIDTLRGRKQHNVRLVYDELPEMEKYVTQGAINLESNSVSEELNAFGLQVIGIGNPNLQTDAHGDMCQPADPLGYKSISKDTKEWKTRTGVAIFLNGEWSPNFEAPVDEPPPFPRLTNRRSLAGMLKRCHGNPMALDYWRNAIGFWPGVEVVKTVLTSDIVIAKKANEGCRWGIIKRKVVCGFDTGFTHGGDKCIAVFSEIGPDENGRMVVSFIKESIYIAEAGTIFEDAIAKQVVDDCIKMGVAPDCFGMDISSDGGKMITAIIRYWITKNDKAVNVQPLSSMEAPSERIVSNVDKRTCREAFDRRVTEYWMMTREAVLCEIVKNFPLVTESGGLSDIADQLFTRTFEIRGKKASLETKDDYKERTSKNSPDNADAFVYMIEMARRHGLVFNTPHDSKKVNAMRIERELKKLPLHRAREMSYESDDWGEKDLLAA